MTTETNAPAGAGPVPMGGGENCANCKKSRPSSADPMVTECHAHPPAIMYYGASHWPVTQPSDWCGEYVSAIT